MTYTASVITVSDRAYNRVYVDQSGPAVCTLLEKSGYQIVSVHIIPDEKNIIIETLRSLCDQGVHLILTTGGTGFAPRDITPEATRAVIERETPGLAELMRMKSAAITPRASLSRGVAGICKRSLIVNLPGSPKGAAENLGFLLPVLPHGLDMLNGVGE